MAKIKLGDPTEVFESKLSKLEPFEISTGNLRGVTSAAGAGVLPEPYRAQFRSARVNYVVYSYATPIAWHDADDGRWHVPAVNYSLTTTQHQYTIRAALSDYVAGEAISLRKGHGSAAGIFGPRGDGTF